MKFVSLETPAYFEKIKEKDFLNLKPLEKRTHHRETNPILLVSASYWELSDEYKIENYLLTEPGETLEAFSNDRPFTDSDQLLVRVSGKPPIRYFVLYGGPKLEVESYHEERVQNQIDAILAEHKLTRSSTRVVVLYTV